MSDAVADTLHIIRQLSELYTGDEIVEWLGTPCEMFDGQCAIDWIVDGRGDEVSAAIERLASGAYV